MALENLTLEALNKIRTDANSDYQNAIPVATQSNILEIKNAFTTYPVLFNTFATQLMNKIGLTILRDAAFTNRLSRFKNPGGKILDQKDVEEIFIPMEKPATPYDEKGLNPFGRREGEQPQVAYHRMNRRDTYTITIGEQDFLRAFSSFEMVDSFVKRKLNAVNTRREYDEFLLCKNLLASYGHVPSYSATTDTELVAGKVYYTRSGSNPNYVFTPVPPASANVANIGTYYEDTGAYGTGYAHYAVPDVTDLATAKDYAKTIKKASKDMTFLTKRMNKAGVMNSADVSKQVLLVNKDVASEVDVELLATVFNPGKTNSEIPTIIEMDDFGLMADTTALLVHEDFFRIWDTHFAMKMAENPEGEFTNYFTHVHQTLSLSPFMPAVRFKKTTA